MVCNLDIISGRSINKIENTPAPIIILSIKCINKYSRLRLEDQINGKHTSNDPTINVK
jgi:hypothetical protein